MASASPRTLGEAGGPRERCPRPPPRARAGRPRPGPAGERRGSKCCPDWQSPISVLPPHRAAAGGKWGGLRRPPQLRRGLLLPLLLKSDAHGGHPLPKLPLALPSRGMQGRGAIGEVRLRGLRGAGKVRQLIRRGVGLRLLWTTAMPAFALLPATLAAGGPALQAASSTLQVARRRRARPGRPLPTVARGDDEG